MAYYVQYIKNLKNCSDWFETYEEAEAFARDKKSARIFSA